MVQGANMAMQFGDDGYLSYNSEKAMFQSSKSLKEMGYKAGDTLWKPGTRDELNGRILTGRIAKITANGNFIPEYEHDAANSAFKGSGFVGWQGEVGLGADQAHYNASMPAWAQGATDPRTGEAMKYDKPTQQQSAPVQSPGSVDYSSPSGMNYQMAMGSMPEQKSAFDPYEYMKNLMDNQRSYGFTNRG